MTDPFEPTCERVRKALVSILIEEEPEQLENGSGVLVCLAGAEFVLTAGHNVWHPTRDEPMKIAAGQLPRHVVAFTKPGDGSVLRVRVPRGRANAAPEPDVAVIELSDRALRHADRQAFAEDEIGSREVDSPPSQLVVGGFPSQLAAVDATPVFKEVTRKPKVDLFATTTVVHSMSGTRAAFEPAPGRGTHIFFSKEMTERDGSTFETFATRGLSGGPLVVPGAGPVLVALVRSREPFEDGYDQWCEPVVEAVRLLIEHDNASVADAARRIVARCEAGAATRVPPQA